MKDLTFDKSRVINFSDAVFSIAMTLLVLEVGIPSIKAISSNSTWVILQNRIPSFIGLVVSFLVTALYWVSHLRSMKYVTTVDAKLLWLNIFLLLFIVLMPFSTGFYVTGFNLVGPFVFYCFNLSAIGLFNFLLIRYIMKKEKSNPELTPHIKRWYLHTALNALIIWILAGVLAFILPSVARLIFILIFVIQFFINRNYKKSNKT
ncbi:TMEM175 family protein [Psychroserpens algicola]|uniref:TMEM175 family protein n=1 Tax=Psychroserpens algicola TaxID=1719034 RepID=A0ABT0HB28_9FLAO|nr:TMEM175 family protein [Psychroserpens algicola]MCK8481392.1 TMEM175 family protein [Psychroserpens algicola]